ncbi:MAG: hypothetical protein R6U98_13095 [Pirellulaceae bacterium]
MVGEQDSAGEVAPERRSLRKQLLNNELRTNGKAPSVTTSPTILQKLDGIATSFRTVPGTHRGERLEPAAVGQDLNYN